MQRFKTRWEMLRVRSTGGGVASQDGSFPVLRRGFVHHERRADSSVALRTNFSIQNCIRRAPAPMDCLTSLGRREDHFFSFLQKAAVYSSCGFPGNTCTGEEALGSAGALCFSPLKLLFVLRWQAAVAGERGTSCTVM